MPAPEPHVYLNGQFLPRHAATVDIEDRGFLFADGVYEVVRYYGGKPLAMEEHMIRLRRSLDAVQLARPAQTEDLPRITAELLERNALSDAKAYWQITRGAAPREHPFPKGVPPTVLAMVSPQPRIDVDTPARAVTAITRPDERWQGCWIKSLMLLPNVMARTLAQQAGAFEAIYHRDGRVTEATASNLFIVRSGALWTHPADKWILGGITRLLLLRLAQRHGLPAVERAFTLEDLFSADEVILCGTTAHVNGVTHVDGRPIGAGGGGGTGGTGGAGGAGAPGVVGPVTQRLQRWLMELAVEAANSAYLAPSSSRT